ncbi:uncharacterized protein [Typha angustifolia]|uniref:uncharacterized protein n=1 Tax=Typha angustifolia TaxID=59011 RepID=UPI003C30BC27
MATSSPVSSNKIGDSLGSPAVVNGNATPQRTTAFDTPKPNLRGLNKPKCIKCGNVARSRCPFQCCKSCCFKAQNPCHIHVLKQNGTLPDKPALSSSPSLEQPSTETPSPGSSWRLNSLRQLSNNFLNSLRVRKPLSRKDIANTNKWRFMKLRQHIQENIEAENEAFERYMQNVCFLEEAFKVPPKADDQAAAAAAYSEDRIQMLTAEMKVRLKANSVKEERFRERIGNMLDQKLNKLREREHANDEDTSSCHDVDFQRELKSLKEVKQRVERTAAISDLLNKLNRARSEDDLRSCLDIRCQLFNQSGRNAIDALNNLNAGEPSAGKQGLEALKRITCSLPTVPASFDVDQDTLSSIDMEFSSLSQIAEL